MKLFPKLLLAVLVIAVLLPFTFLKDDTGDTLMSFSDLSLPDFSFDDMPSLPSLPGLSKQVNLQSADELEAAEENLDGKDIFYKWYDAKGNVQFTTVPPPEGIEFSVKGFDPDANVIKSVKVPTETPEADNSSSTQKKSDASEEAINLYSEESIKKLFEDAKNIEKLLNQRLKDQDSIVNQ